PVALVWRMGWLPEPALLWVAPALIASLFGFANVGIKDEGGGFFLGWPSMWNVVAFYCGLFAPAVNAAMLIFFAVLTLVPVRFLYLTVAPRPWKVPLLAGSVLWLVLILAMLPRYPDGVPRWMVWLSLAYPVLYSMISWHLSRLDRRARSTTIA
ncbi:MAG TPA: hypothetical protein VFR37_16040, partial [Longimicrobium sp.]|nr:hypothetical protein [Longimicrobium sp.]